MAAASRPEGTKTSWTWKDTVAADDLSLTGKFYVGDETPIFPLVDGGAWIRNFAEFGGSMMIRSTAWSGSLLTTPSTGLGSPSIGTCTFDLTGGTYENLFTAVPTGGWTFSASDVGKLIVLTNGAHQGGWAVVDQVIDTTNVTLTTADWDADLAAGGAFLMVNDPVTFTSRKIKQNGIGADSVWRNIAYVHTAPCATHIEMSAAAADIVNMCIATDALGYSNANSLHITHTVGALAAGGRQRGLRLEIDDSDCTGGSTSEIDGIKFVRTKGTSTATVCAIDVGTGYSNAFKVDGAASEDPDYGYTFTAAFAVTDHVNSGGGGDDSFKNAAVNTQMFTVDNSGVLIGSDAVFSVIEYIQQVAGSASISPTWQYSTGDGTWATLVVSDTTSGMRYSGKVSFSAPAGWAKSAHCDGVTGAITNAYYVRITRTQNNLVTPPTEKYFKTYPSASATDMLIRGDGSICLPQIADVSAAANSLYYSTTSSKLCYKDPASGVHTMY